MIIRSLLDTDLYKLTMMQAILHHFPSAQAEYQFRCRTPGVNLSPYVHAIHAEIEALADLRLEAAEATWLGTLPYFKPDFLAHLECYRFDPRQVSVRPGSEQIEITIRGPWHGAILYEVPLLAIVNETYFHSIHPDPDYTEGFARLGRKAELMRRAGPDFRVIEFGTRRRFSRPWHEKVLRELRRLAPIQLLGSSNTDLARRLRIPPSGTMAHEFFQGCQALAPSLAEAQRFALETWLDEYAGRLGIALSDTYGIEAFLADFNAPLARAYTGVRHDSGDPFEWTDRMLEHYRRRGIDPCAKTLVYSDSLSVPRAIEIFARYHHHARLAFGIGTNLTNDLGPEPLNIVIKMTRLNDQAVAKLSDDPGKAISPDPAYLDYLREVYQRKVAV